MTGYARITLAALCLWALVVSPALAERPSVNKLQAEVNQLQAETQALQTRIQLLESGDLRLFDATGNVLGIPLAGRSGDVFNLELGVFIARDTLLMLGRSDPDLFFAEPGCQGQAYIPTERKVKNALFGPYFPDGVSPALFIVRNPPGSMVQVRSRVLSNPPNPCEDAGPGPVEAFPVTEFTGELSFPLPAPEPLFVDVLPPPAP